MPSISDKFKVFIEKAIEEQANGDKVEYDISLTLIPGGGPAYFITALIPSPILGDQLGTAIAVPQANIIISQETADNLIRQMLEALRRSRSEALTSR
jgi:hypothetical protein